MRMSILSALLTGFQRVQKSIKFAACVRSMLSASQHARLWRVWLWKTAPEKFSYTWPSLKMGNFLLVSPDTLNRNPVKETKSNVVEARGQRWGFKLLVAYDPCFRGQPCARMTSFVLGI